MNHEPMQDDGDDAELERALAAAMRPEPMDEASLARMRSTVEQEWRQDLARRRSTRLRTALPIAAALALLIGAGWLGAGLLRPPAEFGSLYPEPRMAAETLRVGTRWNAPRDVGIALASGGSLRARAGSTLELLGSNRVQLERGVIYFDSAGRDAAAPFRIETPGGVVEHLGTQFEVSVQGRETRVRVREGIVQMPGARRIAAGEEVTVADDGEVHRTTIAPYDAGWRWVEAAAPALSVEGRPLSELLRWVARETGRRLEFADDGSATVCGQTMLHGSVAGLPPELALRALLVTTSLDADVRADRIVVHRRGAPQAR